MATLIRIFCLLSTLYTFSFANADIELATKSYQEEASWVSTQLACFYGNSRCDLDQMEQDLIQKCLSEHAACETIRKEKIVTGLNYSFACGNIHTGSCIVNVESLDK